MTFTAEIFVSDNDTERVIATSAIRATTDAQAFEQAREFADYITGYAEILCVGVVGSTVFVEVARA